MSVVRRWRDVSGHSFSVSKYGVLFEPKTYVCCAPQCWKSRPVNHGLKSENKSKGSIFPARSFHIFHVYHKEHRMYVRCLSTSCPVAYVNE